LAAVTIILTSVIPVVNAESDSTKYFKGLDAGTSAAQSDNPNFQNKNIPDCLNSGHSEPYCEGFIKGYYDTENSLGGSSSAGSGGGNTQVNWEDLCNKYGSLVGIHTPCNQLAHGTQLTQLGRTGLACLFSGGLGILAGVINAGNFAEIKAASQAACP
jgi:hypothetical protein